MKRRSFLKIVGFTFAVPAIAIASHKKEVFAHTVVILNVVPGTIVAIFLPTTMIMLGMGYANSEGKATIKIHHVPINTEVMIRIRCATKNLIMQPIQMDYVLTKDQSQIHIVQVVDIFYKK